MIFWVISRIDFMGHFDILLFQTPQVFLETALETGAGDCFAGPGTVPGAPGRPLHLLLVDTLGEGLHHGLQLIEGGLLALPHLLHCHPPEPEVKAAHVRGLGRPGNGGEAGDDPALEGLLEPSWAKTLKPIFTFMDENSHTVVSKYQNVP